MRIAIEIQTLTEVRSWIERVCSIVARHCNSSAIDPHNLNMLRAHFACGSDVLVDSETIYNRTSGDFFLRYGLANLMKNYYALSELQGLGILSRISRIIDVGSGPGTFALAYVLWAKTHATTLSCPMSIVMTDSAREPLALFDKIWSELPEVERNLVKITKVHQTCTSDLPSTAEADLIVFSNSISEILRSSHCRYDDLCQNLAGSHATILVIDHYYRDTERLLNEFARRMVEHRKLVSLYHWNRWNNVFDEVNLLPIAHRVRFSETHSQRIDSNVKFLKAIFRPSDGKGHASPPPRTTHSVQMYKRAWEQHDLNILRELFTEDATYQEKPHSAPLQGIEKICEYWKQNALRQRFVRFMPKFVDFHNDSMIVLWEASFFRVDLNRWMYLDGSFNATFRQGRICAFSEKFNKLTSAFPLNDRNH